MDDDVDFFTRKPLPSKSRAKPKASAKALNGSCSESRLGSTHAARPRSSVSTTPASTSAATQQLDGSDHGQSESDLLQDDEEDEDAILLSSDVDISSDDSDVSAKRRVKRRKKKHVKTLPAWASQGVYRRPSQEPTSSAPASSDGPVLISDPSHHSDSTYTHIVAGRDEAKKSTGSKSNGNGKERGVSLTPPPPPSPEKLSMARELVTRTIASKFGSTSTTTTAASAVVPPTLNTDSVSRRVTRSTRSSATPAFGQDVGAVSSSSVLSPGISRSCAEVDGREEIHWDPDLARLMRGENAKHIREQAKREQRERDERRKQRELERTQLQPSSHPEPSHRQGQFTRTKSAPQTRSSATRFAEDNDSDDSVEYLPRLTEISTSSRRKQSSRNTTVSENKSIIVVNDSDDDQPNPTHTVAEPPSAESGETLSLTLQSKLGSMSVTVTPATRLSTIINHFHSTKLDNHTPKDAIRITFDGFVYQPNQCVEQMDVEDGDQVELSWP